MTRGVFSFFCFEEKECFSEHIFILHANKHATQKEAKQAMHTLQGRLTKTRIDTHIQLQRQGFNLQGAIAASRVTRLKLVSTKFSFQ